MTAGWRPRLARACPGFPACPRASWSGRRDKDKWELYNIDEDWSQANDLADKMPEKLAEMKDLFLIEFTKNNGLPIGGGLWVPVFHPELRAAPPYTAWTFRRRDHADAGIRRAGSGQQAQRRHH